jgi:phosphate transport system substrate-binding protein
MKSMFKKFLVALLIFSSNISLSQKVVIKGSDSVLPLSQKEAEQYMKTNKSVNISVVGGGSGVGIAALIDGTTQIAMTSRPIKMDEKLKLQAAGRQYKEVKIAYDALSIIVNPGNKVSQLTREQIEGIFTGKIKNWKEVGGNDMKIVAYARETSSGTYEFFKEHLLNRKNYAATCLNMPASGAVIQSVSQTKGAIGYVGLAYLDKSVKAIAISTDKGKSYVKPSLVSAKNKTYPIVRPLFFYYPTKSEAVVKPFIEYVTGKTGQGLVSQIGYISLDGF